MVKIAGQSLNGKNLTLNPVKTDTIAMAMSVTADATAAALAAAESWSTAATRITTAPAKRRRAPFGDPLHGDDAAVVVADGPETGGDLGGRHEVGDTPGGRRRPAAVQQHLVHRRPPSGEFEEQVLDVVEAVAVGG